MVRGQLRCFSPIFLAAVAATLAGQSARAAAVSDAALVAWTGGATPAHTTISDVQFAKDVSDVLITGGASTVREASFFFQQCYGGGMIDDLSDAFGNKVKWVAGSASAANEPSIGQLSVAEATNINTKLPAGTQFPVDGSSIFVPANVSGASPAGDFWTNALIPQLGNNSQTVLQAINAASAADAVRPAANVKLFGTDVKETGTSASGNGGNNIVLADAGATNFYAILWAGDPNFTRHGNDVTGIYNALLTTFNSLTDAWSIKVLYGSNGTAPAGAPWTAQAATEANLKTALGAMPTGAGSNTSFVFYSTDHGSPIKVVKATASLVAPGGADTSVFSIDSTELAGIEHDSLYTTVEDPNPGFNPFQPYIEVDYDGVAADNTVAVYAGADLLGYLPAAFQVMDFNIPYGDLDLNDSIVVHNFGSSSFNLNGIEFIGGADGNDPPIAVPEPTVALLGLAMLVPALGRRRNKRG